MTHSEQERDVAACAALDFLLGGMPSAATRELMTRFGFWDGKTLTDAGAVAAADASGFPGRTRMSSRHLKAVAIVLTLLSGLATFALIVACIWTGGTDHGSTVTLSEKLGASAFLTFVLTIAGGWLCGHLRLEDKR